MYQSGDSRYPNETSSQALELIPVDQLLQELPQTLNSTRKHKGYQFVAGFGVAPANIMFIEPSVQEDEARDFIRGKYNREIPETPSYLKGEAGSLLKSVATQYGINMEIQWFTAVVKILLPKSQRKRVPAKFLHAFEPLLQKEIEKVNPKIIVVFGRQTFDLLVDEDLNTDDIYGSWFNSRDGKRLVYMMPDIMLPVHRPEYIERWHSDLEEISKVYRHLCDPNYKAPEPIPLDFRVIDTRQKLEAQVEEWVRERHQLFSVDCEWAGSNHVDGQLRSLQLCWKKGTACYIRFMDDAGNYALDCSYSDAGKILARWLNEPEVKYVGHHISADFPWMHTQLGLEWYNKCVFDTEFALQVMDESLSGGLENVSMLFTTYRRYDVELARWKRKNPQEHDAGYKLVPDSILIPYACYDVLVPFEAYPQILARLIRDNTFTYYVSIFNPFVTDVFTQFSLTGLPMNQQRMDFLRDLYTWAQGEILANFRKSIFDEAKAILLGMLIEDFGLSDVMPVVSRIFAELNTGPSQSLEDLRKKKILSTARGQRYEKVVIHLQDAMSFNINSQDSMRRWLFDVCGLTPVKSTANKKEGMPAVAWEKVMTYPPEKQATFRPAVDKQTLQILSQENGLLKRYLELKSVATMVKSFLKGPTEDEDGNVLRENGIHYWLAKDGRVHGQTSTTETGRPRSWKPNTLNWSSRLNEDMIKAILRVVKIAHEENRLPVPFQKLATGEMKIPSLRSCVDASTLTEKVHESASGLWCMVESDYKTAEIRGQAFKSGDENLIRYMTEPDTSFGLIQHESGVYEVRLTYSHDCGIPAENHDPDVLMSVWQKSQRVRPVAMSELLRDAKGNLLHPPYDLHWSLAEFVMKIPREKLNKDAHRTGLGKIGNFSTSYGAVAATVERKIRADTGTEPEPGIGQKILDALQARQPVSVAFLAELENMPREHAFYQASSGRKRHFPSYGKASAHISKYTKDRYFSGLGREMRNYPFQESVGATAARAGIWLNKFYRDNNMHARVMTILYDSCVTLCPIEERHIVAWAHEQFMALKNTWTDHGRTWHYPIDTEFNFCWSTKASKIERENLNSKTYLSTPIWVKNPNIYQTN